MMLQEFTTYLKTKQFSIADIFDLISYIENISYEESKTVQNIQLNDSRLSLVLSKINQNIPTAYITNRREFYGRVFYINNSTLIPRVETEILIDESCKIINQNNFSCVLDLFTGSGAILLSILSEFNTMTGVGIDISDKALEVANINKTNLGLEDRSEFRLLDLSISANMIELIENYEIILANPPYISELNYKLLDDKVKKEPKIALVAKDDGLFYYNMLFYSLSVCKKSRILIVEIGYDIADSLTVLAESFYLKYYFIKDYSGVSRVMVLS